MKELGDGGTGYGVSFVCDEHEQHSPLAQEAFQNLKVTNPNAAQYMTLRLHQGIHTLRHSCAHNLLAAGAPLPVIQRKLGHKNISTTSVYLVADDATVDDWSRRAFGD